MVIFDANVCLLVIFRVHWLAEVFALAEICVSMYSRVAANHVSQRIARHYLFPMAQSEFVMYDLLALMHFIILLSVCVLVYVCARILRRGR